MATPTRRLVLATLLAAASPVTCARERDVALMDSSPPSPEDAALQRKFRAVRGGELRVDTLFPTDSVVITIAESDLLFNIGMGAFVPGHDKVSGYGGNVEGDRLVVPKHLRMRRFPDGARYIGYVPPYIEGTPIVDVTVPVAQRIPDEALEDLRRHGGGLRLKLRIHPETLLVGWDIVRRPGYDPRIKDSLGNPLFVPAQYFWVGGDFREAIRSQGRILEKGWYIDPKTKQRIETNF